MKWMAVWLGLATTIAVGAAVGDFPAFEVKPPVRPAFDVWVEGENWARTAGKWEVRAEKSCYGEKQAVLVSPEGSEHVVEYAVKIPRAGLYLAAVAGQPVGRGYTSPVWWSVDGGEWRHVTSAPTSGAAWGLAGAVNWTNLAVVELTAGEHRLAIRVNEKRGDGHFAYMVDAVALVESMDREVVDAMLKLKQYIDLVVPRGGQALQ